MLLQMGTFLVLFLFLYAFLQLMLISTTFCDVGQTSPITGTDTGPLTIIKVVYFLYSHK